MDVRQNSDFVVIKAKTGRTWGFHAHALDIFEVDNHSNPNDVWDELCQALGDSTDTTRDATSNCSSLNIDELSLNVSQICNLKCVYCAAGGDGTYGQPVIKLDLTEAKSQISFFIEKKNAPNLNNKTLNIHFLGGEPLLQPDLIFLLCEFAKKCAAKNNVSVTFSITTNGTLITHDVAEKLAAWNFAITVSLDGPPEINDLARPKKQNSLELSTTSTLRGLTLLDEHRNKLRSLRVNSVFGKHNKSLTSAYVFLKSTNIEWDEINFLFDYSEFDPQLNQTYLDELAGVAELAYSVGGLEELSRIKQFATPISRILSRTRHHSYCGAGKNLLQSDAKGRLFACNWFMSDSKNSLGRVSELTFDKLSEYQPTQIDQNNCHQCWARHLCGGGCMAHNLAQNGHRHVKNNLFCERTRFAAAMAVHYLGESTTSIKESL